MGLKLIIVGSIFCIVGILLFFGSWGARLQSIIDTDSLIILNFGGFFVIIVSTLILFIDIITSNENS